MYKSGLRRGSWNERIEKRPWLFGDKTQGISPDVLRYQVPGRHFGTWKEKGTTSNQLGVGCILMEVSTNGSLAIYRKQERRLTPRRQMLAETQWNSRISLTIGLWTRIIYRQRKCQKENPRRLFSKGLVHIMYIRHQLAETSKFEISSSTFLAAHTHDHDQAFAVGLVEYEGWHGYILLTQLQLWAYELWGWRFFGNWEFIMRLGFGEITSGPPLGG